MVHIYLVSRFFVIINLSNICNTRFKKVRVNYKYNMITTVLKNTVEKSLEENKPKLQCE